MSDRDRLLGGFVDDIFNPLTRPNKEHLRFDLEEFERQLGENKNILISDNLDLFESDVPFEWIGAIVSKMNKYKNTYIIKTKNTMRLAYYLDVMPRDTYYGAVIESDKMIPGMGRDSNIQMRYSGIKAIKAKNKRTMVFVDPILSFDLLELSSMIISLKPEMVIIGGAAKNNLLTTPPADRVNQFIFNLKRVNIDVFEKDSLKKFLERI